MTQGIQSGQFRHHVKLEQATETRDATGGVTRAWVEKAERWADISELRGREKFEAQQMELRTDTKIRLRYYPGLDATWRVVHGSDTYNVASVVNVGVTNYELDLQCIKVVGRQ